MTVPIGAGNTRRRRLRSVFDIQDSEVAFEQPKAETIDTIHMEVPRAGVATEYRNTLKPLQLSELLRGPGNRGSAFVTEAQRRQAWDEHRRTLLAAYQAEAPDRVPWAAQRYDVEQPQAEAGAA